MPELRRGNGRGCRRKTSDEDYCEELQQPKEEVTFDVCQSSIICSLPKTGAPATGLPATDPPCRSNKPACRLAGQTGHLGYRDPREEAFPFVNTDVVHNLELKKAVYNIAASNADAGHDLWAFCHGNRLKLPFGYNVAKDIALIQPSSAFMERVFSILRACLDERQETSYSDQIRATAFLKYIKGR